MTVETEKSKKTTVPEWSRRESSTTALKAAAKTRGLSYPHKGKGATRPRREAVHSTHGQCREAWKTAKSCGATKSGYLKYRYGRLSLVRVLGYCWDKPTVL